MHVERVRYAQLVPTAGAVRKPKYVESPRVPGEAALALQRRPEPGEPSASGECLLCSALLPPAVPGKALLCWEQALQEELPALLPALSLSCLSSCGWACAQAVMSQCPGLPHGAKAFWPFPELVFYYKLIINKSKLHL